MAQATIDRVVELTPTEPPHEATHWTAAAMAKAVGISVSSVQRIWKAQLRLCARYRRLVAAGKSANLVTAAIARAMAAFAWAIARQVRPAATG